MAVLTLVSLLHVTYPIKQSLTGNENSCDLHHLVYRQEPGYDFDIGEILMMLG